MLAKFKTYFIQILPRLYELRKEILSNLIELSKSSDVKNYLYKHIQKCSDLEKEEKPLEDYISKIMRGYNQLLTMTKRTNHYINRYLTFLIDAKIQKYLLIFSQYMYQAEKI